MMPAGERQAVLTLLADGLAQVERLEDRFSEEQALWTPPGRWSVLLNIEHMALVEGALFANLGKALETEAAAESLAFTAGRDAKIAHAVRNRGRGVAAPPMFVPTGRFGGLAATVAEFRSVRERTIGFARDTTADLRKHTHPHFVLRDMDVYQWLLFIAAHADRHLAQIEEVAGDAGFPPQPGAVS